MTATQILALLAASFGAGAMNAMAGGGTILTFPTLMFLGMPAIQANATSTVALLPGAAASMAGFRREVAQNRGWLRTLFLPSLLGGILGSILLLRTPEKIFQNLAPLLILFATVLFMLRGALSRRFAFASGAGVPDPSTLSRGRWIVAALLQLAVAVYGGYFGAGIGILMLALLGFLGMTDIHAMNGLKNFFNLCINGVAAAWFVIQGAVSWPEALVIAAGATLGGYGGARFSRRIGQDKARTAVVVIGFLVAGLLAWQQLR